jgi:hypothetical protein
MLHGAAEMALVLAAMSSGVMGIAVAATELTRGAQHGQPRHALRPLALLACTCCVRRQAQRPTPRGDVSAPVCLAPRCRRCRCRCCSCRRQLLCDEPAPGKAHGLHSQLLVCRHSGRCGDRHTRMCWHAARLCCCGRHAHTHTHARTHAHTLAYVCGIACAPVATHHTPHTTHHTRIVPRGALWRTQAWRTRRCWRRASCAAVWRAR